MPLSFPTLVPSVIGKFHWVLYLFGLILRVTGARMLMFAEAEQDMNRNPVQLWM